MFLEKRLKFARALRSRPYAMIWLGQTVSNLGDGIFTIALAWQVLLMTHCEKLGRVISLDALGSFAMIPIGDFLGGVMTDHLGPATVFIVFGIINLVNVLIPLLVRDVRELQ